MTLWNSSLGAASPFPQFEAQAREAIDVALRGLHGDATDPNNHPVFVQTTMLALPKDGSANSMKAAVLDSLRSEDAGPVPPEGNLEFLAASVIRHAFAIFVRGGGAPAVTRLADDIRADGRVIRFDP